MKSNEVIPDLKSPKYNANITQIKRIRNEPRQRIRQLPRSFQPLGRLGQRLDSR
ncbi:hypothetical protein [Mucilaginibacter sp. R-33]|uniref:hypothetical protein n=1 Tax=Mucilaginibacter sp. R-33 TaxID=3416711 RepID=UPI003CF5E6D1